MTAVFRYSQGDDNDIYSSVDACPNACEIVESYMKRKFTSRDGESLESYYSRFYKMMNELVRNQYHVTNHQVNVQFLLQLQPEWQLVTEDEEMSRKRRLTILYGFNFSINLRKSTNLPTTTFELHQTPVELIKIILQESTEALEQVDWKDDTDDESDDQELESHYMYMAQIQEVTPDPVDNSGPIFDDEPMHKVQNNNDNYNVFAIENEYLEQPESSTHIYLAEQERDLLASLIQKLKCEMDDSKKQNKFLESSNKALVDKLKGEIEDFKTKNKSLESSNNHFKEANNELSKTNQLMFKDLKKFQAELDKYKDVNYASKVEIDCAKAKGDLMSYKIDFEKSSNAYTQKINDLNQTISDMKKELCAHQETISIMSQAKEAQIKLYKTREDKELDKVIALENKVKVLNDIVYKTGQSVQTMNMLNRNCKTSFAKPEFLKKAQRANPRLYDIGCYNDNLALMLAPDSDKTIRLDKERRSKLSDLIRPFDYDQLNNLYDLFVPQREKSAEQHYFPKTSKMSQTSSNNEFSKESFRKQPTLLEKRMDESIPWDQKCKSSKELFKIKKSVDTIFDGVERCKQTIAKRTYFGNIDPFIQNTIEGNFCLQISRLNANLEKFHLCLHEEMVADLRYFNCLEHEAILGVYTDLDEVTNLQCDYLETLKKCEHLEKELSKRVTPTTSVSRPRLKSNQLEDRVMPNNSQGKKQNVEDHHRKFKFSNNKTSVTACNDSLNAKTSNVNFVCVTCGKLPISTREPKHNVNQSVTTSRTVKFGNDQIAPILGYGDLVQGSITIKRVYYVEGLNHNLFSVGQFCDADLEVAFWKSTYSLSPGPQSPENVPQVAETVTTSNELELLYSLMFSELLNGTSPVVSKSSAVHAADNPDKRQQHNTTHTSTTTDVADPPPLNIHSTHQTPTQVPTVTAPENIIQAETNTENA
ncbi:hypothetical protein Tco_0786985 [Tanacetum coccineum]